MPARPAARESGRHHLSVDLLPAPAGAIDVTPW
jgi:hypothetical protein